jgi:hypothetical protein
MVCWEKDRDPLKAWNDKMTRRGNKPCYFWAPYPSTPSPFSLLREKTTDIEGLSRGDYLGGYETVKDIDLPPPQPPLRLPSGTGNFNLELQLLDATHCLLNLTNPPLVSDCWLCLSSSPLHYVTTPVSLLNQSMHSATPNSTSTKPKVSNIQLSQRPLTVSTIQEDTIQWENWLLANVPKFKTVQPLPLDVQLTDHGAATQGPLYAGPLLISAYQLTGRAFAH